MAYILTTKFMGETSLPIIKETTGIKFYINGEDTAPSSGIAIRWGCRGELPNDVSVINTAKAIKGAYNKGATRKKLAAVGLAMETYTDFMEWLRKATDGDFILRPSHHTRSLNMSVVSTSRARKALEITDTLTDGYYLSKLIKKKHEYRVFVANNRILWVIEKHPGNEDSISWGCVEQGQFQYIGWSEWPIGLLKHALASMKQTSLDFGAWDIISDEQGNYYSLEVNTAPYLGPYYAKTTGKAFKWMISQKEQGEEITLPDLSDDATWKKFMHPCLNA